jgi:hypothetical protein
VAIFGQFFENFFQNSRQKLRAIFSKLKKRPGEKYRFFIGRCDKRREIKLIKTASKWIPISQFQF